jgi:hypothetical protein
MKSNPSDRGTKNGHLFGTYYFECSADKDAGSTELDFKPGNNRFF